MRISLFYLISGTVASLTLAFGIAGNCSLIFNCKVYLKNNKAPGMDGIRAELLKEISVEMSEPLTFLMNKIIEDGIWPTEFKLVIIKPLFKGGQKDNILNYRPITLISNIAKIFEKLLKVRIVSYFNQNKFLSEKQFGFTEGKSTNDAIRSLTSKLYNSLDKREHSLVVFLDLAKAFDTVNHT